MNFRTSFFSRVLSAGVLMSILAIYFAGCKKDTPPPPPPTAPLVATAALTNITTTGATAGGSIVSDGGDTVTASGIVWSESNAMPTLADTIVAGTTSSGTFSVDISGLEFNKSYYIRAFATNDVGTGYGEVVTLSTMNDTNKVRFTYNGEEVTYGIIVSSASGRKWMDRNLGAKQVAAAYDDFNAYGDLFQWGRPDDGHQVMNWTASNAGTAVNGTTETVATSDIPGHSDYIIPAWVAPWHMDWRADNNRNRWATSPQGPCPEGWHVPLISEWLAEVAASKGGTASSGGLTERNSAYTQLRLTIGGYRGVTGPGTVGFGQVGVYGHYWSSSDGYNDYDGYSDAKGLVFGADGVQQSIYLKGSGVSVRCLKD